MRRTNNGNTSIMLAMGMGRTSCVALLQKYGAVVDEQPNAQQISRDQGSLAHTAMKSAMKFATKQVMKGVMNTVLPGSGLLV